jgi:hypothetical protein
VVFAGQGDTFVRDPAADSRLLCAIVKGSLHGADYLPAALRGPLLRKAATCADAELASWITAWRERVVRGESPTAEEISELLDAILRSQDPQQTLAAFWLGLSPEVSALVAQDSRVVFLHEVDAALEALVTLLPQDYASKIRELAYRWAVKSRASEWNIDRFANDALADHRAHLSFWRAIVYFWSKATERSLSHPIPELTADLGWVGIGYDRIQDLPRSLPLSHVLAIPLFSIVPIHEVALVAVAGSRANIIRTLERAGWERGTLPPPDTLEAALRSRGDQLGPVLPMVSYSSDGRRILLNGHHRIAALITLVADGLIPSSVLEHVPVRVTTVNPDLIVSMWATRGYGDLPRWIDIVGFHPPSRRLLQDNNQ